MKAFKIAQIQILLIGLLGLTQNCSDVNFAEMDPGNEKICTESSQGCDTEVVPGPEPGILQKSAMFNQPAANSTSLKLDILFVTDTSRSLDDERAAVASGLSNFIDGNFQDVRVGVLLGHADSKYTGKLYKCTHDKCDGDSYVLNSDEYDFSDPDSLAAYQAKLEAKLNNVKGESYSDGGEALLISLNKLLEPEYFEYAQSKGFFREDAALAVIFVSDENDICSYDHYPDGISPVVDDDGDYSERDVYDMKCVNELEERIISPQIVLQNLKNAKGDNQVILSGVYYIDPSLVPDSGENEVAYGLIELVGLSIGVDEDNIHSEAGRKVHKKFAIEMASETVDEDPTKKVQEGLGYLGSLAKYQLQLKTSFDVALEEDEKLSDNPVLVYVDGEQVQAKVVQYDHGKSFTVFIEAQFAGRALSEIKIDYSVNVYD